MRRLWLSFSFLLSSASLVACGSSSSGGAAPPSQAAGASGSSGSAAAGGGSSGQAGASNGGAGASSSGGGTAGSSGASSGSGGAGGGSSGNGGTSGEGGVSGSSGQGGAAGDAGASGVGGAGGDTADVQACSDFASAECHLLDQCRGSNATNTYGSQTECVARQTQACLGALAAPSSGRTAEGTEACAMSMASESCGDYVATQFTAAKSCVTQAGSLANGMPCSFNAQCVSEFCDVDQTALCGACAPPPVAGDDCTATRTCGQTGLRCAQNAVTLQATCVTILADGASCDLSADCGPQSYCAGSNPAKMTKGVCTHFVTTEGAACDAALNQECDPTFAGLTCDPASKTCVPVKLSTAGQSCGTNKTDKTQSNCSGGSICTNGVCAAEVKEGMACDPNLGPVCEPPGICLVTGGGGSGGAAGSSGASGAAGSAGFAPMPGVCAVRTGMCN